MQRLAHEHSLGLPGEPGKNINFVKLLRHVDSNGRACVTGGRKARDAMRMGLIRIVRRPKAAVRSWIATTQYTVQQE